MKVKELYKKNIGYSIILYGENEWHKTLKECKEKVIPFSFLETRDSKEIDEMEVLDTIKEEKEFEAKHYSMNGRYRGKVQYKGTIYALVKRGDK